MCFKYISFCYLTEFYKNSCDFPRCGLRTEGPSVASSSSSSRTGARTRCDQPKRKVPPPEKWAQRAGPAASSRRPPAPPQSRPSQPAPRRCPFGAPHPSPRSQTPCLPLRPACRDPTLWPTHRLRATARATPARRLTSVAWIAAPTSPPCTTSCPVLARRSVRWARTQSQAIWTSPQRPSPLRATGRPAWASTPQLTAWIIRTRRRPGSWTSMPIAWIIKIKRPRGNSRSCEQRNPMKVQKHWRSQTRRDHPSIKHRTESFFFPSLSF